MAMDPVSSRMSFDLRARRQVHGPELQIDVAADAEPFWEWYASTIRAGRPFRLNSVADAPAYPPATQGCALWFSAGVESTYTLEHIRHLNPVLLQIEDHPVFLGEDRKIGQVHFLCAVTSASLGFSVTYLGVERNDLMVVRGAASRPYVERTPEFLERWSASHPGHRMETVCGGLHKDQIIAWLVEHGIPIMGTCDRLKDGRWCGGCYKCFEAFYSAKAAGVDLGIRLRGDECASYYDEYRRYIDSGFTDNYNNAYANYVRLQIVHQISIDPAADCVAGEPPLAQATAS
ncbi:MAG TPA: hypothetical protein VFJ16_03360 [Longimicrobium sp.]|nr:hypothetical protein [Longimicrobium sp.]